MKTNHVLSLTLIIASMNLSCSPARLIKSLDIKDNKITVRADDTFKKNYLLEDFFAEYNSDVDLKKLDYSIVTIPFITNIAPFIWGINKDFYVDEMDADLYESLQTIKNVYKILWPDQAWMGNIIPNKLVSHKNSVKKTAPIGILFSGGLDAVASSFMHYNEKQILITYWGSGEIPLDREDIWQHVSQQTRKDWEQNKNFANQYGHTSTFVKSNNRNFINEKVAPSQRWWVRKNLGLGYAGLVAPVLIQRGCKKLLIGSAYTHTYPYPCGTHPAIENSIRYAGLSVLHDGSDLTRSDKVQKILAVCKQHRLEKPHLRVCLEKQAEGNNCCACEKCLRTIHELLVEGEQPSNFGFDASLDQIMNTMRHQVSNPDFFDNSGNRWNWTCLQDRIREVLQGPNNLSKELQTYLQWLLMTKIKDYHHFSNKKVKKLVLLTALWDISIRDRK